MLGALPDAEDAVQETLLRAWRYRDSLKPDAPLRPWLYYRVATNACLDAIARDERRAVLGARAEADDGWAGQPDDVVWLGPIPDSVLEPTAPPTKTPEALTLMRETIELAFLTVIQLLTPRQRVALILCDVLDWSAKDCGRPARHQRLGRKQRIAARAGQAPRASAVAQAAVATSVDGSAAERELLKKYVEATEAADFRAFESIIRADATFRMPPQPDTAAGREAMFKLWVEEGFGSERFGRLHCVVTHANLQPAVAAYVCQPGDSTWRALALDVLRIEDGLIAEIVTFSPDTFPLFGLPMLMDPAPEMNVRH